MMDFDAINRAALRRLESFCRSWAPEGRKHGHEWVAKNPTRRDRKAGSFSVNLNSGRWGDFSTGDTGGDAISLYAYVHGVGQGEAARELAGILGLGEAVATSAPKRREGPDLPPAPDPDAIERRLSALDIWRATQDIEGTASEHYLRVARSISIRPPTSLRHHPGLWHSPSRRTFPAMVAAVQAPDGRVGGVMRTFLTPDGSAKAPVEKATQKMALGSVPGGAVRLANAGEVMGQAEGIETGLSAQQLYRLPVWAALGTKMAGMWLPDAVRHVIVFGDRGEAGELAAEKTAEARRAEGRKATIIYPELGDDFNTWLQLGGKR